MSGKYSVLGLLIGLAGGLLAGGAIHASPAGALRWLVPPADVLGNLWLNTLQMLALPLTLAAVIGALTSRGSLKAAGHITGGALFLFFLLLALAGAFTAILSPLVISWLHVDTRTLAALGAAATGAALPAGITPTSFSMSDLILSLIPRNVLRAALDMELLPVLVLSMLFGFALNRTRNAAGMAVIRVIQGFTDALLVLVGWVIRLSPAGVFALSLSFAAGLGFNLSAVLGKFVILSCSLLLAFTLLMYPARWLLGGIAPRKFAAAILPAQVTAVGTRSPGPRCWRFSWPSGQLSGRSTASTAATWKFNGIAPPRCGYPSCLTRNPP
jgi:Na+/H+-dicarboxylate symporter